MRTSLGLVATLALAMLLLASPALSQQATEQFIPIGQSPGLGPEDLVFGPIEVADPVGHRLVVAGREIAVDGSTRVYLDRSSQSRGNLESDLTACHPGLSAEVRLEPAEPGEPPRAAWIKLRIERSGPPR